jgi:hypothetical protein
MNKHGNYKTKVLTTSHPSPNCEQLNEPPLPSMQEIGRAREKIILRKKVSIHMGKSTQRFSLFIWLCSFLLFIHQCTPSISDTNHNLISFSVNINLLMFWNIKLGFESKNHQASSTLFIYTGQVFTIVAFNEIMSLRCSTKVFACNVCSYILNAFLPECSQAHIW